MTRANTTWDQAGFYQAISDIRALAAELRYIDGAVDYLENDAEYDTPNEVSGPVDTVDVTVGWTYPFTMSLRQPHVLATQAWADGITEHLQGIVDEATTWADGQLTDLSTTVQPIAAPNPAAFTDVAAALQTDIADPLETTIPSNVAASYKIAEDHFWGSAALEFRRSFATPFADARDNQSFVAQACAVISAAAAAIIRNGQHSIMNAVVGVRDTLEAQIRLRQYNHGGAKEVATILIISSYALKLLGYFTLPAPVDTVAPIADEALDFALDHVEEPDEASIDEQTAEAYLRGLNDVIDTILANYGNHWDALEADRVALLAKEIDKMPDDSPLFPARPDLADGATPAEFYFENSGRYTG